MPTLLIIDDETSLINSLAFALEEDGYTVHGAETGAAGLAAVASLKPDLVLLDLRLPDMSGLDVITRLAETGGGPQVIMISAHGDTRAAVKAVKLGAADYLTKPFDLDDLLHTIGSTLERQKMASEIDFHRQSVLRDSGMVAQSRVMRELGETIKRVASSSSMRILILGESGTGKTLVAKAIHAGSARAGGPFIEINCASLPEQLIEAELFGAEKGAYTGAHQRRVGLVSLANGGTLFLDEIGEMPLALQAKMLHFLENGQYRPIGAGRNQTADVRVIAATNRDLAAEVVAGRFREDLYYRLNVICLNVPPLRGRQDDILLLAMHCAARCASEEGVSPITLDSDAARVLLDYRWPGNVRQLKNLIERLTILYPERVISPAELPPEMSQPSEKPADAAAPALPLPASPERGGGASISDALADAERDLILQALQACAGHKGRAADRLGISRHAFKRRLQRLGIR